MSEGDNPKVQQLINVSPVIYRLPGTVNDIHLTLLLDTGAAITLLREDVWGQIAAHSPELKPWPGATLVSAGGMLLTIHGCACVHLELGGRGFKTEMVVVNPLTSVAIQGIDFLQGQQAVIDLGRRRLCLRESGCDIPLDEPAPMQSCAHNQQVRASNTVKVPPRCIMEISAYVETAVDGVWLVEEAMARDSQLAVARAVVEPASMHHHTGVYLERFR